MTETTSRSVADAAARDAGLYSVPRFAGDVFDLFEMRAPQRHEDGASPTESVYFEEWPTTERAFRELKGRFCAIDGGYIARVVKSEPRFNRRSGDRRVQGIVTFDFGCFVSHDHEEDYVYDVLDYSEEAIHTRLFRADFVDRWDANHPNLLGAMRWITEVAPNGLLGIRCSRYNAFRHLHFRYLLARPNNVLPSYLHHYTVNMRPLVAFSIMEALHAQRAQHGLSMAHSLRTDEFAEAPLHAQRWNEHPQYSPRVWGDPDAAPLFEVTVAKAVGNMMASMRAAKNTMPSEIEGILITKARSAVTPELREQLDADMTYGGCFPATCTFGWSSVRVGRQPRKQFAAFQKAPTLRRFCCKRDDLGTSSSVPATDELDCSMRTWPMGAEEGVEARAEIHDPDEYALLLEDLEGVPGSIVGTRRQNAPATVSQDVGENASVRPISIEDEVSAPLDETFAPLDFIQRKTRNVRKAISAALYTWIGARAHEMAFVRLLFQNPSLEVNDTLRLANGAHRDDQWIRCAFAKSTFSMPHIASQFSSAPDGRWLVDGQYFRDIFPQIPRAPFFVQPIPQPRENESTPLHDRDEMATLCHVYAANTHSALRSFMRDHGQLLFSDERAMQNGANASARGRTDWRFIGAEYPVYNPYTSVHEVRHVAGPPLFFESRVDAVVHANWTNVENAAIVSELADDVKGRVIIVEYKMLMEATKCTPRILSAKNQMQALTNAFMFYMCVGILPSHCLVLTPHDRRDGEVDNARRAAFVTPIRSTIVRDDAGPIQSSEPPEARRPIPRVNRSLFAASIQFDMLRVPIDDSDVGVLGERNYEDEPDENRDIRRNVNECVQEYAETLAREFENHDSLTLFTHILDMRDPSNGRRHFGTRDDEFYNPDPEEDDYTYRGRTSVMSRSIHRLLNVRIHAAISALVCTPTGSGWFEGPSLEPGYSRIDVFPHVSDRGMWSNFALRLMESELNEDDREDVDQDLPPARRVIDVAVEDLRAHLRTLNRNGSEERRRSGNASRSLHGHLRARRASEASPEEQISQREMRAIGRRPFCATDGGSETDVVIEWYHAQSIVFELPSHPVNVTSTDGQRPCDVSPATYPVNPMDTIPISARCADLHTDLMTQLEEFCRSRRNDDTQEASRRAVQIDRLLREYDAVRRNGEMLVLESPALAACRAFSLLFEPMAAVYGENRYRSLLARVPDPRERRFTRSAQGAQHSVEDMQNINMIAITIVHESNVRCEAWLDVRVAGSEYTLTGVVYRSEGNHFFGDILRWNDTTESVRRAVRLFRSARINEGVEDVTEAYDGVRRPADGGNDVCCALPTPRNAVCCLLLYCRRDCSDPQHPRATNAHEGTACQVCDEPDRELPRHLWRYCSRDDGWPPRRCMERSESWILCPVLYEAAGGDSESPFPREQMRQTHEEWPSLREKWERILVNVRAHLIARAASHPRMDKPGVLPRPTDGTDEVAISAWLQSYLHSYDHNDRFYVCPSNQISLLGGDPNEALLNPYRTELVHLLRQ
ncbi:hypothetical protein CYMTET_35650 [Cymbomonas tetramitiformis]|uniref:Uncharacterized protein n=1 Tax=Cymbomonas tetramitiformis TaxID=36881 RepID=A0AAE0F8U0_9CHLO|nr:hypothetical protein CYMTET_35650 [Cymbomonas tetramitiformis]